MDTNICIFFLKGRYFINKKLDQIGAQNCFISEITVAELKYGVENSKNIDELRKIVEAFIPKFTIIPVFNSLDIYAKEKARLRKSGLLIDDFDLLIGATAVYHDMVMVTNNVAHLSRLKSIVIEDWTSNPELPASM